MLSTQILIRNAQTSCTNFLLSKWDLCLISNFQNCTSQKCNFNAYIFWLAVRHILQFTIVAVKANLRPRQIKRKDKQSQYSKSTIFCFYNFENNFTSMSHFLRRKNSCLKFFEYVHFPTFLAKCTRKITVIET